MECWNPSFLPRTFGITAIKWSSLLGGRPPRSSQKDVFLGLHRRKRLWDIVNVASCDIVSEEAGKLLQAARLWALERGLSAYHSRRGTGELRHLVIREGKNTGQRMVNFLSTSALKDVDGFLEALTATGVRLDSILWSRTDGVADVAQGETSTVLSGEGLDQGKDRED